jgi:protocatechuate 3,4-dioxygenase alpha subunit
MTATPSQTVGPFFSTELVWRDGGAVPFERGGQRIVLTGQVLDGAGAPVDGALLETWQVDAAGKIPGEGGEMRPLGYGRVMTSADGQYAIDTVMPGAYPGGDGARYAPQISVTLFARGLLKAVRTRVFLADLDAIGGDPLARALGDRERLKTLVATRDPGTPATYRWDIRLRGPGETVFLDF